MTELKNELKAAMMEMFAEMFQPQKAIKSTGFGPLTAVETEAKKVFIQASHEESVWYTLKKTEKGYEVDEFIMDDQFTGRVVRLDTADQQSKKGNASRKMELTMADADGAETVFVIGLCDLVKNTWVTAGKCILVALEVIEVGDWLTIAPVAGEDRDLSVVLISTWRNGVPLYEKQKGRDDWGPATARMMEKFGGKHRPIMGQSDEPQHSSAPASTPKPAPTSRPAAAPASALSKKMSDAVWLQLKCYEDSTERGIEFNRARLKQWCMNEYGIEDPRQIPAVDQSMALFNAEKMLHDAHHPPAQSEPEEVAEEEQELFVGEFDDIPF
jgi:hypothetical protein